IVLVSVGALEEQYKALGVGRKKKTMISNEHSNSGRKAKGALFLSRNDPRISLTGK
ncbi:hypothetical protein ABVT39_010001, partial [Epinephelus coioides]